MDESGEFASDDGNDVFEESRDDPKMKNFGRNQTSYQNKPYDEAYELSQDLSVAESFDGRDKNPKERKLANDKYDEAFEVSQSMDQSQAKPPARNVPAAKPTSSSTSEKDAKTLSKNNESSKSQSVLNKPFDEALEFSQSGSEESVDTRGSSPGKHHHHHNNKNQPTGSNSASAAAPAASQQAPQRSMPQPQQLRQESPPKKSHSQHQKQQSPGGEEESSEGEEDGDIEESYENIEGAYNAKDYAQLNVSVEVRDLFQYIERYKPHEVQLDAPLKCFIPEYIPAIGELDPFIKVPRPDEKEDGLGLRFLDEPSPNQSDPTVLELQLRAKSKKMQYGDVAVRSIENADKNPSKIEKWIQDIKELHRSKPPPQVNYKKNMPEIDALMEQWPEEAEQLFASSPLPSPDLDLTLPEYARALCTVLDIPTNDNPIESLHLMFSLFIEFRNNPHFQARMLNNQADGKNRDANYQNNYGNADVLEIDQSEYK